MDIEQKQFQRALKWITGILNRLDIPFQVTGGLAARLHGATRGIHDIDIYVQGKSMAKLKEELQAYIEFGPTHYTDRHWDLVFMSINYSGQKIEFTDADRVHYFDSKNRRWVRKTIDFDQSVTREFHGIEVPVMPRKQLIEYKRRLNRQVDRQDLREISDED